MAVRVTPADDLANGDRMLDLRDEDEAIEPPAAPGSLLDRLRTRAADTRVRTLDVPMPGRWRHELVLRFRPLGVGQLERFVEARRVGNASGVGESIEVMATCCVGVYGRDGERMEALGDADGPVRLEHRLGVLLGMPAPYGASLTTREVVLWLFEDNSFALASVVDRLVEWAQDPDANEPAGES
jgi:hypothetical protein